MDKAFQRKRLPFLRKNKLVEGRVNSLYLSAEVAKTIDEEAQYIKNKGFDDQYYRDLIVEYLKKYGKAKKKIFATCSGINYPMLYTMISEKTVKYQHC